MPMQTSQISVREVLEIVFANKWLFLLCVCIGLVAAYFVSEQKTKTYRAEGALVAQNPISNDPLTKGVSDQVKKQMSDESSLEFRFNKSVEKLLDLQNLQRIAQKLKVAGFNPADLDASAKALRNSLVIGLRGSKITIACSMSVLKEENVQERTSVPEDVARVINEVGDELIKSYELVRDEHIQNARKLLQGLRNQYDKKVRDAEVALGNFDQLYRLDLLADPTDLANDMNSINLENSTPGSLVKQYEQSVAQHMQTTVDLLSKRAQREELQKQIEQEPEFYTVSYSSAQSSNYEQAQKRYVEAQSRLETLRKTRTDLHPEVRKLAAEVEELRTRLESVTEPVVKEERQEANPLRVELKRQISQLDSEIVGLEQQQATIKRDAEEIGERIKRSPSRATERNQLMADLQVWEKMRNKVTQDIAESQTAIDLSSGDRSMRFIWSAKAVAPRKPVGSNEQFILIMGVFIGAVVGVILCFVREFTDTSFRNIEDASRYLDLPVLGAIPEVPGVPRRRRIRSQKRSSSVAHLT
ncbi:MAG TPA: hypothetical protein PKH31_11785 [Candidatus Sumerlaeota bacterium]|nr:hypothetical protein [Candidatus Sumerlaeota bacterium]